MKQSCKDITHEQQLAVSWYQSLQSQITHELLNLESLKSKQSFQTKEWSRDGGGGGKMMLLRGEVFEKVGVNFSQVYGKFQDDFVDKIPGAKENNGMFWASGVSIVAHPKSPFVPIIHMNTRMIVTSKLWFGGGIDLTPVIKDDDMATNFHTKLKKICDNHNHEYYPKFKKWCDDYFYIKHRGESRGVGGIFYDNLSGDSFDSDFLFNQDVGKSFVDIYKSIVLENYNKKYSDLEIAKQQKKRGRYVEFNLLYDRGTKFGIMTNGNTDAVLMSMPPIASW